MGINGKMITVIPPHNIPCHPGHKAGSTLIARNHTDDEVTLIEYIIFDFTISNWPPGKTVDEGRKHVPTEASLYLTV